MGFVMTYLGIALTAAAQIAQNIGHSRTEQPEETGNQPPMNKRCDISSGTIRPGSYGIKVLELGGDRKWGRAQGEVRPREGEY
jgi:hypothetical protein